MPASSIAASRSRANTTSASSPTSRPPVPLPLRVHRRSRVSGPGDAHGGAAAWLGSTSPTAESSTTSTGTRGRCPEEPATTPSRSRSWRLNLHVIRIEKSPAASNFGFYTSGQSGTTISIGTDILLCDAGSALTVRHARSPRWSAAAGRRSAAPRRQAQARRAATGYDFDDSHFHLTNYIQEGTDVRDFLRIMGTTGRPGRRCSASRCSRPGRTRTPATSRRPTTCRPTRRSTTTRSPTPSSRWRTGR